MFVEGLGSTQEHRKTDGKDFKLVQALVSESGFLKLAFVQIFVSEDVQLSIFDTETDFPDYVVIFPQIVFPENDFSDLLGDASAPSL